MSRTSDQLDTVVEALNTDAPLPSSDDDRDLQGLFEVAQLVHDVAERDWPEPEFGARLAERLSSRLYSQPIPAAQNGMRPLKDDDDHRPPPLPTPDVDQSQVPAPSPWYHEWLKLVAGVLVIVAVGALLAATLGGQLFGSRPSQPAAQPSKPQSIYDSDVDLQRAHQSGWGENVNQSQSASNVTVTLRWAGSDTNWIFLVFDIVPPTDWSHGFFTDAGAVVTLPDRIQLSDGTGGCNKRVSNGVYECMMKYLRPASLRDVSTTKLDIEISKLTSAEATPPSLPVDVPGPFKFNVSVPLHSPNILTPTPVTLAGLLPSRTYVIVNGFVDVFDATSGDLVHQIPLEMATQSPFVTVDAKGDRLFVTDAGPTGDRLTIYRTTDWSIERQVPVPNIIRYLGTGTGIAASSDGRYAYVYNYNDRTRGSGPVDYWLATYDVQTGEWLDKTVDLPRCGVSQLMVGASGTADVRCHDTGELNVVDPIAGKILRTMTLSSMGVALGENVYAAQGVIPGSNFSDIGAEGAIQILNTSTGSRRTVPEGGIAALHAPPLEQTIGMPDLPIGISLDGSQLFVPIGSNSESQQHLADSIAVIDTHSGNVRWVEVGNAFHSIAYSPDGTSAFVQLGNLDSSVQPLERIDLRTGAMQSILQAPMSPQMVIAP